MITLYILIQTRLIRLESRNIRQSQCCYLGLIWHLLRRVHVHGADLACLYMIRVSWLAVYDAGLMGWEVITLEDGALMAGAEEGVTLENVTTSTVLHPALVIGCVLCLKSLTSSVDSSTPLACSWAELVAVMSWSWLHDIVRYVAHSLAVIEQGAVLGIAEVKHLSCMETTFILVGARAHGSDSWNTTNRGFRTMSTSFRSAELLWSFATNSWAVWLFKYRFAANDAIVVSDALVD